ncbi:MAG: hypothetical protein OXC07_02670 [Kistimonas sp.]|nr:hypothetical protein [Kistimonas sp.]
MLVTAGFTQTLELGIVHNFVPAFLLELTQAPEDQPQHQFLASAAFHREGVARMVQVSLYRLDGKRWMEYLAKAGTPAGTLAEAARHWQVPVPSPFDSWEGYSRSCYDLETISADVLRWHSDKPDVPVPLTQVWPLVRSYVREPSFARALNDESQGEEAQQAAALEGNGLLALLREARAHCQQKAAGGGLAWTQLERLATCQCIEPAFIRRLSTEGQPV